MFSKISGKAIAQFPPPGCGPSRWSWHENTILSWNFVVFVTSGCDAVAPSLLSLTYGSSLQFVYFFPSASKIIAAKQKRRRSFWKSSALRDLGNDDEDSSVDQDRYDSMKNALLDFSSGTSAAIPLLGNSAPLPRLIFPGKVRL